MVKTLFAAVNHNSTDIIWPSGSLVLMASGVAQLVAWYQCHGWSQAVGMLVDTCVLEMLWYRFESGATGQR